MAYVLIDPSATLSFSHDYVTDGYLAPGETIVSRQWTISPLNEGTPVTPALVGDTTDTVFVSGLEASKVYRLTEQITTSAGNVDQRTIVLRAEDT
jgi:hypothetical protein